MRQFLPSVFSVVRGEILTQQTCDFSPSGPKSKSLGQVTGGYQVENAFRRAGHRQTPSRCLQSLPDGQDSDADANPEMGLVIVSVSLGAERLFRLKALNTLSPVRSDLPHRSLLMKFRK